MNDCPNGYVRDLLPDLLHDRLPPDERQHVQLHVDGCVDCRAELVLLGQLRITMHRVSAVNVAAIAGVLPEYRRASELPVRRSWGGWRAAAAVTAILVGGTSVALVNGGFPGSSSELAIRSAPASTGMPGALPSVAAPSTPAAADLPASGRELAMAGGSLGELSEGELSALLDDMESLDALTSTDVEGVDAASPVAPAQVQP
jgi:hypothetical protein